MAAVFVLIMAVPPLQDFFAIDHPARLVTLSAVGVAAMAGVALDVGWQASGWMKDLLHHPHPEPEPVDESDEDDAGQEVEAAEAS
jgi:hypothetical protein